MKSNSRKNRKSRAQAMVEFALALPVLLLLLYGVLETGRLLFIYASTITAARQAVRYGSATGESPNGMPYYQDCAGIEAAARSMGFINVFENIDIEYDDGPGTTAFDQCPPTNTINNNDRIKVSVSTQWQPIVPIVPLDPFTIQSQSARTILASVSIAVEAPVINPPGSGTGVLTIDKSGSPTTYSSAGQTITYTYLLTNTGTGDLTEPFSVTDDKVASVNCSGAPATLAQGGSFNCTGTYQITQNDMDSGSVTNTASAASSEGPSVNNDSFTVTAIQSPGLTLDKSASPTAASTVGATITYTYTLENSGNVTLSPPFSVDDNKIAEVNCSDQSPLPPGGSKICLATYQLTNADIENGSVTNQAVATATFDSATVTSNTANATVTTSTLTLAITPSPAAASIPNQVITYTYTVKNTSGNTANSLSITSSNTSPVNCPTTTIPAGGTVTCTSTYTVTQADLDTGGIIVNTATATANNGAPISSNTVTNTIAIVQTAAFDAVISASPSQPTPPATTLPVGTVITYTYTLTNSGNVTLTSPFSVTDDKTAITCSNQTSLAPGATRNCTGTYTVTNDDLAAGSITNTGTASAKFGSQTVTSDPPASFTVITYTGARFSMSISADPASITQSGTSVVFTYTITNTGGKPLTAPFSITSSLVGAFTCNGASPLAPGASTSCQNSYTTSNTITNTITAATAKDGAATVSSSNLPSITVPSTICTTGTLTLSAPVQIGNTATWTISNNIGTTLHINSISVSWSTSGNRYLGEVQLPAGTSIWTGSDKDGFAIFNGLWAINVGDTQLVMLFTKSNTTITDMNLTFDESGCGPLNNP